MVTKQVKISELPIAGELTGDELFEVVQGGANKKVAARNLFLAGPEGKSAYDIAVEEGFTGTQYEWLVTLVGQSGAAGKSAYRSALDAGFVGTEAQWIASLKGKDGTNGTNGTNGIDGRDGKSAYQVAVSRGFVGSEVEWLASLKGADGIKGDDGSMGVDGKSAYQLAVEGGFAGTVSDWLASLKGDTGVFEGREVYEPVDFALYDFDSPTTAQLDEQYEDSVSGIIVLNVGRTFFCAWPATPADSGVWQVDAIVDGKAVISRRADFALGKVIKAGSIITTTSGAARGAFTTAPANETQDIAAMTIGEPMESLWINPAGVQGIFGDETISISQTDGVAKFTFTGRIHKWEVNTIDDLNAIDISTGGLYSLALVTDTNTYYSLIEEPAGPFDSPVWKAIGGGAGGPNPRVYATVDYAVSDFSMPSSGTLDLDVIDGIAGDMFLAQVGSSFIFTNVNDTANSGIWVISAMEGRWAAFERRADFANDTVHYDGSLVRVRFGNSRGLYVMYPRIDDPFEMRPSWTVGEDTGAYLQIVAAAAGSILSNSIEVVEDAAIRRLEVRKIHSWEVNTVADLAPLQMDPAMKHRLALVLEEEAYYVYMGNVDNVPQWRKVGSSGSGIVVSEIPPETPTEGLRWINAADMSEATWVVDADTGQGQWVECGPDIIGVEGASAYELALNAGFVGTEAEWRESLRGQSGTPMTVKNLNGNYVLALSDAINTCLRSIASDPTTITVPAHGSVPFEIGTAVLIGWHGVGEVTIAGGVGVTLNTPDTLIINKRHGKVTVIKVGENEWDVEGNLRPA